MRIPQFVADSSVQATTNVIPANAYGAEVFNALGDLGKEAFAVVERAEQHKADLERTAMFMNTSTKAEQDYADKHNELLSNPNSVTHAGEMDAWSKDYNDRVIGEINDPIVKKAVISKLGQIRGQSVVQARDQARTMARGEAWSAGQNMIKAEAKKAADSGMDPEITAEAEKNINTIFDGMTNGGILTPEVAYEHRKNTLEAFWIGGVEAKMDVDPQGTYDWLRAAMKPDVSDPAMIAMKESLGANKIVALTRQARQQVEHNESLIHTQLERRSEVNKDKLMRVMGKAKGPADYADLESAVNSLTDAGGLKGGDAIWLREQIRKQQEGGGVSDPIAVAQLEYQIYTTRGSGVSPDTIYAKLGRGLDSKDVTRLMGLKESLEGKPAALSAAMTHIEKAIMPGMLEDITHAHKVNYNLAVQELMTSTNYGNADPKTIRDVAFGIADRFARSKTTTGGSSVFTSLDDLNKALDRGKVSSSDTDGFVRDMALPPKWDSWDKISRDWRDGKINPDLAKSLHRRMFPTPLVKGKKK